MKNKYKTYLDLLQAKNKTYLDKIHNLLHPLRYPVRLPHTEIEYSIRELFSSRSVYKFFLEICFLLKNIFVIIMMLFYFPLSFFGMLINYKFLRIKLYQIGDYQYLDIIIREYYLKNKKHKFVIYTNNFVPNKPLLDLFKKHVILIDNIFLKFFLLPFYYLPFISDGVRRFDSSLNKTLSRVWNNSVDKGFPFLKYEVSKEKEKIFLDKIGLKENEKFCLLNVRTPYFCDSDPSLSLRNADIQTYYKAIDYIIEKGFTVVRGGVYEKDERIKHKTNKYIDYGLSEHRSYELDCYLLSNCTFVMGTNSGLSVMGQSFNKTWVYSNANSPHMCLGLNSNDICIFKKIFRDNEEINFEDYFEYPYDRKDVNNRIAKQLNLKWVDNTSEEILDLVSEFFSQKDQKKFDSLQKYSKSLLIKDKHFVWGCRGNYALSFLNKRKFKKSFYKESKKNV